MIKLPITIVENYRKRLHETTDGRILCIDKGKINLEINAYIEQIDDPSYPSDVIYLILKLSDSAGHSYSSKIKVDVHDLFHLLLNNTAANYRRYWETIPEDINAHFSTNEFIHGFRAVDDSRDRHFIHIGDIDYENIGESFYVFLKHRMPFWDLSLFTKESQLFIQGEDPFYLSHGSLLLRCRELVNVRNLTKFDEDGGYQLQIMDLVVFQDGFPFNFIDELRKDLIFIPETKDKNPQENVFIIA